MDDSAHGVDLRHEIFQGPLDVQLEFVEEEKPDDYFLYPGTKKLDETIKVWRVQTKKFPEIDPGLVSSRDRFTATPDAEIISGGINGKGPDSVAIGRHGNYLLWGFYARPSHMTPSAQRVFVNALAYMHQFDGRPASPVVMASDGRNATLREVYYLRSVSDVYVDRMVDNYQEYIDENPDSEFAKDKKFAKDPKAFVREMYADYAKDLREKIPLAVREACDEGTEKLIQFYADNLEYLWKESGQYVVDEDVKQIGISNRHASLIDKCIEHLETDDHADRAMRVLKRYTDKTFSDAGEWITWHKESGKRLRYDESRERFIQR